MPQFPRNLSVGLLLTYFHSPLRLCDGVSTRFHGVPPKGLRFATVSPVATRRILRRLKKSTLMTFDATGWGQVSRQDKHVANFRSPVQERS